MLRVATLVFCSIFLAGCFGGGTPIIKVVEVRPESVTPEGRRFVIVVDAENPSDKPLPLKDATYSLSIDGKKVFEGQRSPESTLRKFSTNRLYFPVAVPSSVNLAGRAEFRANGNVVFLRPGKLNEILYEYGVIRPSTGFSGSGAIDLNQTSSPVSMAN